LLRIVSRLRLAIAGVTALALVLGTGAVALGAGNPTVLRAPKPGGTAHTGKIRLVVYAPGASHAIHHDMFAEISTRRLIRHGMLESPKGCSSRCDFVILKPWKGHPGYYTYVSKFNFHGYWAVTPGKYYWQIHYYTLNPPATIVSAVRSFRVVG
jgi:hypothetical protein